ncbi:MAG: CFI-box-CTERM domain-containing protein [Candidatus Jorgensenbacteria bacterium]
MSRYTEKDAGKDTGASGKETASAWHQAREDARKSGEIGGGKGCFIATAVYDDFNAPQVETLRKFRDESLLKSVVGRFSVRLYYWMSPPVANFTRRHRFLKSVFRLPLNILVRIVK